MPKGTCIHFTGWPIVDDNPYWPPECKAGVNYRETFGKDEAPLLRLPCVTLAKKYIREPGNQLMKPVWVAADRRGRTETPCSKRILPSEQELAAEDQSHAEAVQMAVKAIRFAETWRVRPRPDHDRQANLECPECGNSVRIYQSRLNGHVHLRCATPGCLSLVE